MTRVRRATAGDVPGLVTSSKRLFLEDAGTRDPSSNLDWPDRHGAEAFAAGLDDPTRLLLVVDRDGEVLGHLSGAVSEPDDFTVARTAVLRALHVHPSLRSAGVGAKLVATFVAWAAEQDATVLEVTANATNTRAIAFYERSGFRPQRVTLRLAP